jgi:F-type H+-transporting ATPase subunit epsilon
MAENLRLEVVTPEKSVVSENAQIVMAPGSLGEFGVLTGHTPFLTTLKTGALKYKDESGRERFVFVSSGFAEALPDRVTVLAESAERRKDIDIERAKAAMERAEKRLQTKAREEEIDFLRAKAALLRAISRIQLAQTR